MTFASADSKCELVVPHSTDTGNTVNFSEGRESRTISLLGHAEGYRAYRSGLFVWRGALRKDTQEHRSAGQRKELRFPNVIYDITEFVLFCKRYYGNLDVDAVSIRLALNRTQERQLTEIGLGNYICYEPSISAEELTEMPDLAAFHDGLARRFLKHFFALFNWNDPSEEMLQKWQQKLLGGSDVSRCAYGRESPCAA